MPAHDKDIPAEKVLFDAADALRGSVESAVYKHLVLGLVFLKYVSDAFATQRSKLEARTREPSSDWFTHDDDEREAILEDRDEYASDNVFWIPREARWDAILALGSQPDLGVQIDRALDAIEQENAPLKGDPAEGLRRRRDVARDARDGSCRSSPASGSATTPSTPATSSAASTSTSSRSSRAPRVTAAASSTPPPTSSGCSSRCCSRTRAASSTRRAARAACSSSRRSSSPRTPAGPRSSRSTARR